MFNFLKIRFLIVFFLGTSRLLGQFVAITIDDVPNTRKYSKENYKTKLLNQLDKLQIPIAIFINEGFIYKTGNVSKNFQTLENWVQKDYITVGNHTFSHAKASAMSVDSFARNVEKGEYISRELLPKYKKQLQYFRFPYNDLGKDTLQQQQIEAFLYQKGYQTMPFTIESSDYLFNDLYEYYLDKKDLKNAKRIGNAYIENTLAYFQFFDSLATKQYGRKVKQIYICHDNSLNADYLPTLIAKLKEAKYSFISIEEALKDEVYQQKNYYFKKWGISWFYRWMKDQKEAKRWLKSEPNLEEFEKAHKNLIDK